MEIAVMSIEEKMKTLMKKLELKKKEKKMLKVAMPARKKMNKTTETDTGMTSTTIFFLKIQVLFWTNRVLLLQARLH